MPPNVMIEWNKEVDAEELTGAIPDITIYEDGLVRLGPRLGGGQIAWHRLLQDELEELRVFVFEEQAILEIEQEKLLRAVQSAVSERQKSMEGSAAMLSTAPQMDASTTVLRIADTSQEEHEIHYYDLFGDVQRYPEVEWLQRLRAIELRLLEIVENYAAQ